jgi:nicotinate-nucleotide--dimethylbenzimidazole phosphoribosyltransferase
LDNKISVIRQGISINNVDKNDPIDILHKVGGFDIGVMAGFMLGCAKNSKLVIIDGYISTVAALLAVMINPKVKEYMIPSHSTYEKGGKLASELLGLRPYLDMEMRLGEGSGSALMFGIIDSAISMNLNMLTFDESGIEKV